MNFKKIYRRFTDRHWTIGFLENSLDSILSGESLRVNWLKHNYNDRWFADPFILDVGNNFIYLLVEEYYMPISRAYISKLTINKNTYELVKTEPVLKLQTHLSYPAIIRRDGNVYIYPESGKSGKLMLYKYDVDKNIIVEERLLIDGDVGDATYTDAFGEDLLFCTFPPKYNEDELHICRKGEDGLFHSSEIIRFDESIARMAGDFFQINGTIYRPAQDCNKSYGNGTVIQEVSQDNGKWEFKEVRRYYSPNKIYPLGIHTLNSYKGLTVVDAVGYWHPIIGKALVGFRELFR